MIKMQAMQVARCYFDAWNRRDAEAIVATFVKGGTYTDPSAGEGLVGEAIATYAKTMWSAFPDLVFDIGTVGHTEGRQCCRPMVDARHEYRLFSGTSSY
jgi:hypothetical protein